MISFLSFQIFPVLLALEYYQIMIFDLRMLKLSSPSAVVVTNDDRISAT